MKTTLAIGVLGMCVGFFAHAMLVRGSVQSAAYWAEMGLPEGPSPYGMDRGSLLSIRQTNLAKELAQLPSLGDVRSASISPTIDTGAVTITLTFEDRRRVTLWTEGEFTQEKQRGWMGGGPMPPSLPVVTVMNTAKVRSMSPY